MKLHEDKMLFADIIARAAEHPSQGGLGIPPQFIEKDYWITNALRNLSESPYADYIVFKGGNSLSNAHHIGMRLSDDINIGIIRDKDWNEGKLKSIIHSIEKSMSRDLTENVIPQSLKGSNYKQKFYSYPLIQGSRQSKSAGQGQLFFKINPYTKPLPYKKLQIRSFVYDYLSMVMGGHLIEEYGLKPFEINVLDKRTTMTEEVETLIRFSLAKNPLKELETKICYFYDLYYLMQDSECQEYLYNDDFKNNLKELLKQDRILFDNPFGWRNKSITDSPLISDFKNLWKELRKRYENELPLLAYSLTIPPADEIEKSMNLIIDAIVNRQP